MKTRITRNELKKNFDLIIKVPYCKLQYVLDREDAVYYNAGVYGWNYDVYSFKFGDYRVAISTGNRPIGIELLTNLELQYIDNIGVVSVEEGYNELIKLIKYKLNIK